MSIARPPATSPKKVIQSVEGQNIDQWQSVNINKFVPEVLQQILDQIAVLTDTVSAVLELGLEVARILAALTSELFDLLKAVITGIADAIKSLLDLFPLLDAGIYFLWIPTEFGGIDYFTRTFKNSLTDNLDPMRPPQDEKLIIRAMFFLWGAPWYDEVRKRQVGEIGASFERLFSIQNKVEESLNIPYPDDFTVTKGQFAKPKDSTTDVTNAIIVPRKTLSGTTQEKIRTTVKKISRKSDTAGISHNLRWRVPEPFGAFTRSSIIYKKEFSSNEDNTESHVFTRQEKHLIGIDIVRGERLEDVEYAKKALQSPNQNPYSFGATASSYADNEQAFVQDTVVIHQSLSSVPGTDYYIDVPPAPDEKDYYYAAAFVYQIGFSQVYATKQANKTVNIDQVIQLDIANGFVSLPDPDPDTLDDVDFANVDPADVQYPLVISPPLFVGPATPTVAASATKIVASSGGAPPDWIGFSALGDLLPEIQKFVDKSKNLVDTIVDSILDDVGALENWIQTKIKEIEDLLNEVNELVKLLNGLLFPPLAGINYLNLKTSNGMPSIIDRYERALAEGLKTENGAFNPLLLDQGFQAANPTEFARRVDIPAYDQNHLVGGFILVFQEPAVEAFFTSIFELGENFTDSFQQILNDTRLQLKSIKLPELREIVVPTHPFVELEGFERPDDFMNQRSRHKSGAGNDQGTGTASNEDAPVNADGNVEMKSKPGPFINNGPPIGFSVLVENEDGVPVYHPITIPRGTISAAQMAALIPSGASVVSDGSFVIEGKSVGISPCSADAAALFGIEPGFQATAANQNPFFEGEEFEIDPGDLLVAFVNNGRPTLEMRQAEPPIFQLKAFSDLLLTSATYSIKIDIEGDEQIIDVTGNAGANSINKSPTWFYEATFPLTIVAEDIAESVVGNDQFTFQISGTPVTDNGVDDTPKLLTLRPLTYRNIHELSSEILRLLIDAGYPIGLFSTTANEAQTSTTFFLTELWAQTADVVLAITPETRDFIAELDTNTVNAGTDKVPYLIDDVVANLNAAYPQDFFSNVNGSIRITGTTIGPSGQIKVYTSIANNEYAIVSKALFGFNQLQVDDTVVQGIGTIRLSNEYWVALDANQVLCVELRENGDTIPTYELAFETDFYEIEILNAQEQEYSIEFVA